MFKEILFDLSKVNVASFNVNGLRSQSKRRGVFNYLKYFKTHIVLLQETHSVPEDETIWSNEWGSRIHFAHGSNFSKGVAVMFAKNFPAQVGSIRFDINGRFMVMELKISEVQFTLLNVYAPNEDDQDFFVKVFEVVDARENESLLLAGDFNLTMDPELDLLNNMGSLHVRKRKMVQEYLESKDLVDIWRVKNPDKRVFSWRKPNSRQLVMSRLDYFFLSQDLVLRTQSVDIKTRYSSDHCRIVLTLDLSPFTRGKGFWKFNNLHLKDPNFLQAMNNIILQELWNVKNREQSDLGKQWEMLKLKMSDAAKQFAVSKSKERNQLIEKLENRILILDRKMIDTTDEEKRKN